MSIGRGPKLYVGGLSASVSKDDLMRELSKFGAVGHVWIARNPPGFAFVEFEKAIDAEKAVRALDGITVCDSRLRVEFANNGPKAGSSGVRRAAPEMRNGRNTSQRRYESPPRRGRSPFIPNAALEPQRNPYEQLASIYNPDMANAASAAALAAGFPYQLPGYPAMFPFIPPEDLLRGLASQRRRSSPRAPSPGYRRRSRSPIENGRSRGRELPTYNNYDRRDNYERRNNWSSSDRARMSPPPPHRRISSPMNPRHETNRARPGRDERRRR